MSKGQRGNKEAKKPKKAGAPARPATPERLPGLQPADRPKWLKK